MKQFIQNHFNFASLWHSCFFALSISVVMALGTAETGRAQTKEPFDTNPVTIEGHGRALEDVLTKVQLAFNYPIYYEELPLENMSELKSVTGINREKGLVSPVSSLTVTLSKLDSTPYLATQSVLAAYAHAGYPGTYKVVQNNHRIDVLPAQLRSSNGSIRDVTPILMTPVNFPIAKRSVVDTVQLAINAATKESSYRVLMVGAPTPHFQSVELGANGEALGDVLENLSSALSTAYSFAFRYVPDEKTYYFDVVGVVAAPVASGKPLVQDGKKPRPINGPPNNPFFVKTK